MENEIIHITQKALGHILKTYETEQISSEKGFRISVVGGGCSGLSYNVNFDVPQAKDNIFEYNKIKIIIDPKSSIYLRGVTLDYQDGLNGKGFQFKNPNATNTCGCGESFSI